MPSSSVSSLNSWGVYLLSAVALLLLLSPELTGAVGDSRESADWRNLDGVRAVVDSLHPGLVVNLTYGGGSTSDLVELRGAWLSCSYGNGTLAFPSRWPLPNVTLTAGAMYLVRLSAGRVQVAQTG
jgi:hypothetical protein